MPSNLISHNDPRITWSGDLNHVDEEEKRRIVALYFMPGDRVTIKPIVSDTDDEAQPGSGDVMTIARVDIYNQNGSGLKINCFMEGREGLYGKEYLRDARPLQYSAGFIVQDDEDRIWFQKAKLANKAVFTEPDGDPVEISNDIGRHVVWNLGVKNAKALAGDFGEFHFREEENGELTLDASPWVVKSTQDEIDLILQRIAEMKAAPRP